jgi:hypothetical protein
MCVLPESVPWRGREHRTVLFTAQPIALKSVLAAAIPPRYAAPELRD